MTSDLPAFVPNIAKVPDEPGCSTREQDFGDTAFLPPTLLAQCADSHIC